MSMLAIPFNGDRLREARRYRRLTITELAKIVGVSKQTISKYERNEGAPKASVYQLLVRQLDFPLEFFKEQDNFQISDDGTFYRSQLTATQSEKRPSDFLRKSLAIVRDFLDDYIEFPELVMKDYSENPKRAAHELRTDWKLGQEPILNMLELLEIHGFTVGMIDPKAEKVDAFGSNLKVNNNAYYVILVDKGSTFFRLQFSLAHELAHKVLHAGKYNPQELSKEDYRTMEHEADTFASNFLLPEIPFKQSLLENGTKSFANFVNLKSKWHVSAASMMYRARELGILTVDEYIGLQKSKSAKGWTKEEPFDATTSVPKPELIKQSIDLLDDQNIVKKSNLDNEIAIKYHLTLPKSILAEVTNEPVDSLVTQNIVSIKSKL